MPQPLYQSRDWLERKYIVENMFINDIARLCNVSHACILKWIKRFGFPRKGQPIRSGSANPHWKSGRYISSQGYRYILSKGHPRAINGGYVPEHILVAEKILGRFLFPSETVHHLDSNKLNNVPSNLYIFPTKQAHDTYHRLLRWKKIERLSYSNLSTYG